MSQAELLNVLLASEQAEDTKRCTVILRGAVPGCRVEAVYSAEELLQCVAQGDWDAIVLDESMTPGDALERIAELRGHAPNAALIVQTESDDQIRAAEFAGAGADCCLYKNSASFVTELPIVMREVLERSELRYQLDLARQRYDRLTERVTGLVYQLDRDGRFTQVSQTITSLLGYSAEELIGKQYLELIHPDDHHSATSRFNEKRSGARATNNMNIRLLAKGDAESPGDVIEVEFSATGLYSGRRFQGTIGVIRDDSWRTQELCDLEARLRQEFDSRQEQNAAEHQQRQEELREEIQRREESLRQKQLSSEQQTNQFLKQVSALQDSEQQHRDREARLAENLQSLKEELKQQQGQHLEQEARSTQRLQQQQQEAEKELKSQTAQLTQNLRSLEEQLKEEQARHLEEETQLNVRLERQGEEIEKELKSQKALLEREFQERHARLDREAQSRQGRMREEFLRQAEAFRRQQEEQLRELKLQWSSEGAARFAERENKLRRDYQAQIEQLTQELQTRRRSEG